LLGDSKTQRGLCRIREKEPALHRPAHKVIPVHYLAVGDVPERDLIPDRVEAEHLDHDAFFEDDAGYACLDVNEALEALIQSKSRGEPEVVIGVHIEQGRRIGQTSRRHGPLL